MLCGVHRDIIHYTAYSHRDDGRNSARSNVQKSRARFSPRVKTSFCRGVDETGNFSAFFVLFSEIDREKSLCPAVKTDADFSTSKADEFFSVYQVSADAGQFFLFIIFFFHLQEFCVPKFRGAQKQNFAKIYEKNLEKNTDPDNY